MITILKNILGNNFPIEVVPIEEITTLCGGYIILPTGQIIEVKDADKHVEVFSNYLKKYLNREIPRTLEQIDLVKMLLEINCIVYLGIKSSYIRKTMTSDGLGTVILPENYEDNITEEQKEVCLKFLESNKSIFGDYDKLELQFLCSKEFCDVSRNDFMQVINSNKKQK